jgi:xylulokinase
MADETIIGIDIGTTAVKALLLTTQGRLLDRFEASYPTTRPARGIVEQDPEDWFRSLLAALSQFERNFDLRGLCGIGICSQVNTHVFVGGDGQALRPAIVWQDGRCADVAEELDARVAMERRIEWWGAPLPIDASNCLSRMEWVRRNEPDVWARTRWVMAPKDHCILRLTGEAAADAIASVGLVDGALRYLAPLLDLVPGAAERLAPLHPFTQQAGRVAPGLPCAGKPVMIGTMDAWGGMFGVGVSAPGSAMYLSGTSEVIGIVSPDRIPTPGVIAFPTYEDVTLHAAPTQSGGASMAWLSRLLGEDIATLAASVGTLDPADGVPLFLPHLEGERAPVWDPHARGVFLGIDASTSPAHLARSVMEGVAYSARWILEALEHSAGCPVALLNCGGGGFRSDAWNQIRADVLGRTLRRVSTNDVAALGAATIAAAGVGARSSIAAAAAAIVRFDREYRPDPRRADRHDIGFGLYKEAYEATKSIGRRWSQARG